jgi:hypothetical protein
MAVCLKRRNNMKRFIPTTIFIALLVFMAVPGFGETILLNVDNTKYWTGWGNGTQDDKSDTVGTPNIILKSVELNSGMITKVTFHVTNTSSPQWWYYIKPADLFVDSDHDGSWDYVVKMINGDYSSISGPAKSLYKIELPLNKANGYQSGYLMSYFAYGDYRENHPIGVTSAFLLSNIPIGSVITSDWPKWTSGLAETDFYFNFGSGLPVGSWFDIGWTPNCANDAIYESIYVPEPDSLFFLGAGMILLMGIGRKRSLNKKFSRFSN